MSFKPIKNGGEKTRDYFDEILDEMKKIHDAKRHDYAGVDPLGNFRECERAGIPMQDGILARLGDKYTRINNLYKRGGEAAVAFESIEDTLLDLANYSVILLSAIRREGLPNRMRIPVAE